MAIKIWTTDIQKCFIWTTPVKSIWSWDTQVRPSETVQTFDFQNDWALSWTAGTWGYGTPDYVSWQGWRIYRASQSNDGYVYPPLSIFDNNILKQVKIWMYKWIGTTTTKWVWAWICNTAWSKYALWSNVWANYDRITLNGTRIQTANVTGEVVFILDLSGTNVSFSINGTQYSSSIASSNYTNLWGDKTFSLEVANWSWWSWDIYIRKVEITTA